MQGIEKETIIFSGFVQIIQGDEYRSYDILGKSKDENGNLGRHKKIGTIGPDTRGQFGWINDRQITIFSGCYLTDGSSLEGYVESRVGGLSFDMGSGNPPPEAAENN
ncbi:hypothetical protein [Sphingopyxis sp.]|uniref:hypothetical protein n=1 Tax=Sphingopyxis sp. TaxID=1908224 RepID=UPI002D799568|nr:hypothetical protein [Sphingopyxis sp.]HET6526927.1 hypothetical protein [Sphingopyxis sp.]